MNSRWIVQYLGRIADKFHELGLISLASSVKPYGSCRVTGEADGH